MPRRNKKNPPPPPPSPKDSCKFCLKLSKCSRCKEAFYCSADCQKKDWVNHKETCKPQTSEQHSPEPPLPPNEEESCKNCGISGVKLSLCACCQETKYCSRECQRENWKEHKVEHKVDCHSAPSPQAFQDKCRVCFNSCGKAGYCDNCIGIKNFGNTFPLKVPLDVYQRARERYRGFELVTNFKDIEPIDPITYEQNNQVLLALLYGHGGHPFLPCMDMRDEKGKVYMLVFYLDNDDKPNRDFQQKFIIGNYVCIPYPYFLSGMDVFRIDTTDGVSIIESIGTKVPTTTYTPTNVPNISLLNIFFG